MSKRIVWGRATISRAVRSAQRYRPKAARPSRWALRVP